MRALVLLALLLAVMQLGCPRQAAVNRQSASTQPVAQSETGRTGGQSPLVTAVFSATESDPWTSAMINAVGAELGFDPWAVSDSVGSLDLYGPYDVVLDERDVRLSICLSGFTGVVDVPGQEALGGRVREWLAEQEPDLVWLDGDPLQFQVGGRLPKDWPLVFSGAVLDRTLYYEGEQMTTGVYKRFSLPRILKEIWRADADAMRYALLSDDSPVSMGRVLRFTQLEAALPEGHHFYAPEAAESWAELREQIDKLGEGAIDAVVICGAGEQGASADFLDNPCPEDLLGEAQFPVVVLSPSKADHSGAISLKLKPAAHAAAALDQIARVLAGTDPRVIPVITPDDMAVFLAVGEEAAEEEAPEPPVPDEA